MDIKTFKKELKEIGGVNKFGDPNLILVHGSTARWYANGPLKYTSERRCKQVEKKLESGLIVIQDHYYDVADDIWVIEEWIPPEFCKDHEQHRYVEDEKGEQIDFAGPFPSTGKYRALLRLEDNEGKPFNPDERVLQILRKAKLDRNEVLKHGETEQPTETEIQEQMEEYLYREEKKKQALRNGVSDMVRDAISPHKHRLHLANHTEGMHRDYRRGATYDPLAYDRLKEEKKLVISNN